MTTLAGDKIPVAVNMRITVFWDIDVLLGKWVIRFWRNSSTVIICVCVSVCVCVCVWVALVGAKAGGVQLMMFVALDGDQILVAPIIEKR
jgi:hypothetical protein